MQSGHKRRLISFGESAQKFAKSSAQQIAKSSAKVYAKASARGSASVVIETNADTASSYAKATVNVQGGRASAKIESNSLGRGLASGQAHPRRKRKPAAFKEQDEVVSGAFFEGIYAFVSHNHDALNTCI